MTLDSLLFLVFPFAVHDAYLKVVAPVCFQDFLLAVWTLLVVCAVLLFILSFAHVVLPQYHVRIEGLVDLLSLFLHDRFFLLQNSPIFHNLSLQSFLLPAKALLILVHQLLLRQDFLIVVKFNLLDNDEVVPVYVVFRHFLITIVLSALRFCDTFLLV